MIFSFGKKTKVLTLFVGFCLVFGVTFLSLSQPKGAEAQAYVPVFDYENYYTNQQIYATNYWYHWTYYAKEFVLDPWVWAFIGGILAGVVDDIMDWVAQADIFSSLFPTERAAFVQNPLQLFDELRLDIADQYIGEVIGGRAGEPGVCPSFPAYTTEAIETSLRQYFDLEATSELRQPDLNVLGCDFDEYISDYEDFVYNNNFYAGGWEGFFSMTQNPSHNPVGAYLIAKSEIEAQQQMEQEMLEKELEMGDGFFSPRDPGDLFGVEAQTYITPGSVIGELTSQVAGTDMRRMEQADEVSEIVAILIGLLMDHIFSTDRGLVQAYNPDTALQESDTYLDIQDEETADDVMSGSLTCGVNTDDSLTLNYITVSAHNSAIYTSAGVLVHEIAGVGSGSYTVTGLPSGTSFTFELRDGDRVLDTATCSTSGDSQAPAAPTGFSCEIDTSGENPSVHLTWNESMGAQTYSLGLCTGDGCDAPATHIHGISGTSYTRPSQWNTYYRFWLQATNPTTGDSPWVGPINCEVPPHDDGWTPPENLTPPAGPDPLSASCSVDGSSITVTWTAVTDATYQVRWEDPDVPGLWRQHSTSATSYTLTDATPGQTYTFEVRYSVAGGDYESLGNPVSCVAGAGSSSPSDPTDPTDPPDPTDPSDPDPSDPSSSAGLTCELRFDHLRSMRLEWDTAPDATGYRLVVFRCDENNCNHLESTHHTTSNIINFSVAQWDTTYMFNVQYTTGSMYYEHWAGPVFCSTLNDPNDPDPPDPGYPGPIGTAGCTYYPNTSTIHLNWSEAPGADSYRVLNDVYNNVSRETLISTGGNTTVGTSLSYSNVVEGHFYDFFIEANYGGVFYDWVNLGCAAY